MPGVRSVCVRVCVLMCVHERVAVDCHVTI